MTIDLEFKKIFDCEICPTRCDGRSKTEYVFKDDVALSEEAEDWVLRYLVESMQLEAEKTQPKAHGLPDIEVFRNSDLVGRVEVKAQGRAFMAVSRLLPKSDLLPYETVALNLSDLQRYLALQSDDELPLFILWRVRRPCLGEGYWGNEVRELGKLLERYGSKRRFRRKSTPSDYVGGMHKGVTVNYHFSLKELYELNDLVPHLLQSFGMRNDLK